MLHIIRQQHLHVELNGSESDGMALQRRLPGLCQDWLLPALERTLDRFAPPEDSLYIERLDIDAGAMSLDRLEHDLAEAAAQALEKALREQTTADTLPAAAGRTSGNAWRKTVQQSVNEAFVFFLETGQLPWSFRLPEGRSLEQAMLEAWEKTAPADGGVAAANTALRQVLASAAARERLTRQFTPMLLKTLLAQLAPETATAAEQVLAVLRQAMPPADIRHVERLVWDSAFASDLRYRAAVEHSAAADLLARHWPLAATGDLSAEAKGVPEFRRAGEQNSKARSEAESSVLPDNKLAASDAPSPAEQRLVKAAPQSIDDLSAEAKGVPEFRWAGEQNSKARSEAEPSALPDNKLAASDAPFSAEQRLVKVASQTVSAACPTHLTARRELPDLIEGVYINNSGIVLLHPFLPQFFCKLGIAAAKQLLQPERALCLLHFLATGQLVAPEYELTLPKAFCNIPLEMPVEADVGLTTAEQDEAVSLLKAVIQHWDALRNTSPDGLRGTFFIRPGKISRRGDDWLLQVEPQTWDILLDQLPWGIGMIKLPWMERMLHVEWRM